MNQFRVLIAIALLVASLLLLSYLLFAPRPIQIVLETGQEVATQDANYFTLTTVLVLIFCSFLTGSAITFLYYNAENNRGAPKTSGSGEAKKNLDIILPLLRDDEKKAVRALRDGKGELLQNELALRLGIGKVKMTRVLAALERKQLISKERYGMTNRVRLMV